MSRSDSLERIPVNLIQQPVERAALLVWVIAFAQFFTYSSTSELTGSLSWYLTAPALMLASMVVAIRSRNFLPLLILNVSGAIAVLALFMPEVVMKMSGFNLFELQFLQINHQDKHQALMILNLYTLVLFVLSRHFLYSRAFIVVQQFVNSDKNNNASIENKVQVLSQQFESFLFLLTFIIINITLIFSLNLPEQYTLVSLSSAIIFLFISGAHISPSKRGLLLPIYLFLLLMSYLLVQSDTNRLFLTDYMNETVNGQFLDADLISFIVFSFVLWGWHNFISQHYNRFFKQLNISTTLWPLLGLFVLVAFFFNTSMSLIIHPLYLVLVVVYLFLILRNTSSQLIPWAIILLFSLLMLVVEIPLNMNLFSRKVISHFGFYGQQSLLYCFSLILFSLLWERYINPFLMKSGWSKVSFKQPVIAVTFAVAMLWYVINIVMVTGLITGWFDLIHEGLAIEMTTVLVIISFVLLSQFISSKLLANLTHSSLMFLIIVLWYDGNAAHNSGGDQVLPVYALFSLIHLLWVALPVIVDRLYERFGGHLKFNYPENFNKTAIYWIMLSFVMSIIYLLNFVNSRTVGLDSSVFFSSIVLLFIASLIMSRRYVATAWGITSYLLAAALIVSIRFMILGYVPVNAYDTSGILIVSMILYGANQQSHLPSLVVTENIVMSSDVLVKLLPLTALLTISWQVASLHSSITLLLLGVFYLLTQKNSRLALYSGFLFINLSIYLWMPIFSNYTNMMLLYIMPVSFSLLFITHLHRNEIKPGLRNNMRLMALGALYLVAAADIFISSSLLLFFVGLLMGLLGIMYGISRKTKAFLFTGIGFIVINILGQLIVFYPDDRLGRALILMATGALITAIMVWLNIKREYLLSKIQLFRSDIEQWD